MNRAVADYHGSRSTRLHFPIRKAAKDKQLDCRIPLIPSISIIHTIYMPDMSTYNMASQQNSTTQVLDLKAPESHT